MDTLFTIALVIALFLVVAVIAFTIVTNKIIKDQDVELKILRTDNESLRQENAYLQKRGDLYKKYASNKPVDPKERVSVTFTVVNPEGKKVLEDLFKEW